MALANRGWFQFTRADAARRTACERLVVERVSIASRSGILEIDPAWSRRT